MNLKITINIQYLNNSYNMDFMHIASLPSFVFFTL